MWNKVDFDISLHLYQNSCFFIFSIRPPREATTILTAITIILILPVLELDIKRRVCILLYLASSTQHYLLKFIYIFAVLSVACFFFI